MTSELFNLRDVYCDLHSQTATLLAGEPSLRGKRVAPETLEKVVDYYGKYHRGEMPSSELTLLGGGIVFARREEDSYIYYYPIEAPPLKFTRLLQVIFGSDGKVDVGFSDIKKVMSVCKDDKVWESHFDIILYYRDLSRKFRRSIKYPPRCMVKNDTGKMWKHHYPATFSPLSASLFNGASEEGIVDLMLVISQVAKILDSLSKNGYFLKDFRAEDFIYNKEEGSVLLQGVDCVYSEERLITSCNYLPPGVISSGTAVFSAEERRIHAEDLKCFGRMMSQLSTECFKELKGHPVVTLYNEIVAYYLFENKGVAFEVEEIAIEENEVGKIIDNLIDNMADFFPALSL